MGSIFFVCYTYDGPLGIIEAGRSKIFYEKCDYNIINTLQFILQSAKRSEYRCKI